MSTQHEARSKRLNPKIAGIVAKHWPRECYDISIYDDGRVYHHSTNEFLNTWPDKQGVICFRIPGVDGFDSKAKVHRLVAHAFVEKPNMGKNNVYHIDGNKRNNHWTNLTWSMKDAVTEKMIQATLKSRGENSKTAKLKETQVVDIKLRLAVEDTTEVLKELAEKYGVTTTAIYSISKNKSWKHVSIEGLHNPYLTNKEESQMDNEQKKLMDMTLDELMAYRIEQMLRAKKEPEDKGFLEKQAQPKQYDLQKRQTYMIDNELIERMNVLAEKYGRGFKVWVINEALREKLDRIEKGEA